MPPPLITREEISEVTDKTISPGITLLTLNRPEKRNALNIPLLDALDEAIQQAVEEKQRVIILRGAGKVFCAGLDLSEASDREKAHNSAQAVARTLKTCYYAPLVIIGAVHGAAIAGGAGLMAACDLAVATPECVFGYPETRRGLVAGLVMTFLLRQVGERTARELLLTGELIGAEQALRTGLINRVVSPNSLLDEALVLAESVTKGAPGATARSKELIDKMQPSTVADDVALALDYHMQARDSEEATEGIDAFLEKREPVWRS